MTEPDWYLCDSTVSLYVVADPDDIGPAWGPAHSRERALDVARVLGLRCYEIRAQVIALALGDHRQDELPLNGGT